MTLAGELQGAGRVTEVVSPVVRWTADIEGHERHGTREGTFVVDYEGAPLRVTANGRDLCGDSKRIRMAWSELTARFDLAPGSVPPFTEVKVDIVEISVDTPVAFVGEVTDRAIADDGGPRESPSSRPSAVRATVVGVGDDASELVDRELAKRARRPQAAREATIAARAAKRARTVPWHKRLRTRFSAMTPVQIADVVLLGIVVGLLIKCGFIAADGTTNPRAPIGFACSLVAIAVALRPSKQLEPFRAREKVHGRILHLDAFTRGAAFLFALLMISMGLGVSTGFLPTGPSAHHDGPLVIATFGLFNIALLLAGELVARPTIRRLSLLANRDSIEGVLRANGVTVGGKKVALARVEQWGTSWSNGKSYDQMKSASFSAASKLALETADGEKLELDPQEIAWSTTIKFRHETGSGWEIIRSVPIDERVVVRGARDGNALRSKGLSPVLLLAGPAAPRAWAARAVRWRYLVRCVLVAAAVGVVLSSGWIL